MLGLEEISFLLEDPSFRDYRVFSEVVRTLDKYAEMYLPIVTPKNPDLSSKLTQYLALLRRDTHEAVNTRDVLAIREILSIIEQIKIKRGQGWLLAPMRASGYVIDEAGVCNGITEMASRAFLLGEMDVFDTRLKKIGEMSIEDFRVETDETGQVANNLFDVEKKRRECLEKGEIEHAERVQEHLIDMMSFFDGVALYQAPEKQDAELFEDSIYTQDSSKVKSLLFSPMLDDIVTVGTFFGVYSKDELVNYLDFLKEYIGRCSFSLKIHCNAHAISLSYNYVTCRWLFVDPSDLPGKEYIHTKALVQTLLDCYAQEKELILCTTMDATKAAEAQIGFNFAELKREAAWQHLHEISAEKVNKSGDWGLDLFHYAATIGDFTWIEKALKYHHSPALIANRMLRLACISGQNDLIVFLISKQMAAPDYEMLREVYLSKDKYASTIRLLVHHATISMIEDVYL